MFGTLLLVNSVVDNGVALRGLGDESETLVDEEEDAELSAEEIGL